MAWSGRAYAAFKDPSKVGILFLSRGCLKQQGRLEVVVCCCEQEPFRTSYGTQRKLLFVCAVTKGLRGFRCWD